MTERVCGRAVRVESVLGLASLLLSIVACDSPTEVATGVKGERFVAAETAASAVNLQFALTDEATGQETFVYGLFSDPRTPSEVTSIAVRDAGADSVTVYTVDAGPRLSGMYRAHVTGGRAPRLIQFEPVDENTFNLTGLLYDWELGAGTVVFRSRITAAAGGFSSELVYLDTVNAGSASFARASAPLDDGWTFSSAASFSTGPTPPSFLQSAASDCKSFMEGLGVSLDGSNEGSFLESVGKVGLLIGAVGLTISVTVSTAPVWVPAVALIAGLGGGAITWPNAANKLVSEIGVSSACASEPDDPAGRGDPRNAPLRLEEFPYSGGSVSVEDNGSLADDAFSVQLDTKIVGRTELGDTNSITLGALRPGMRKLTLVVTRAPDNRGTYGITLSGGLTFVGGGTRRSGVAAQGARIEYMVQVPLARRLVPATRPSASVVPSSRVVQEEGQS